MLVIYGMTIVHMLVLVSYLKYEFMVKKLYSIVVINNKKCGFNEVYTCTNVTIMYK